MELDQSKLKYEQSQEELVRKTNDLQVTQKELAMAREELDSLENKVQLL